MLPLHQLGNATDFGDLTYAEEVVDVVQVQPEVSLLEDRVVLMSNIIDYIEIATTEGNAVDFGDLSHKTTAGGAAVSNAHGGL